MKKICTKCKNVSSPDKSESTSQFPVTGGICSSCIQKLFDHPSASQRAYLDSFDASILLMQPEPRRVRTANKSACDLLGKDLLRIEGYKGGEVFDCEHAFTQAGCGMDVHCQDCKIRNTIVTTFKTGASFSRLSTFLNIRKNHEIRQYGITISTEKVGPSALVRIDQFRERKSHPVDTA